MPGQSLSPSVRPTCGWVWARCPGRRASKSAANEPLARAVAISADRSVAPNRTGTQGDTKGLSVPVAQARSIAGLSVICWITPAKAVNIAAPVWPGSTETGRVPPPCPDKFRLAGIRESSRLRQWRSALTMSAVGCAAVIAARTAPGLTADVSNGTPDNPRNRDRLIGSDPVASVIWSSVTASTVPGGANGPSARCAAPTRTMPCPIMILGQVSGFQ